MRKRRFFLPVLFYGLVVALILRDAGHVDAGWMFLPMVILYLSPFLLAHLLASIVCCYVNSTKWNLLRMGLELLPVTIGIAAIIGSLSLRTSINNAAVEDTKRIGNEVRSKLLEFKNANGNCPKNLSEIYADAVPGTAVKGSNFKYSNKNDGCYLSFKAPEGVDCITFGLKGDWYCED